MFTWGLSLPVVSIHDSSNGKPRLQTHPDLHTSWQKTFAGSCCFHYCRISTELHPSRSCSGAIGSCAECISDSRFVCLHMIAVSAFYVMLSGKVTGTNSIHKYTNTQKSLKLALCKTRNELNVFCLNTSSSLCT